MKFSEIKNRAVVDLNNAKKIGNLDSLLLNPENQQVMGLKVNAGLFSSNHYIPLSEIRNVGHDAITVNQTIPPEEAGKEAKEDNPLKQFPDLSSIMGKQIVSQSGKLLGTIDDVFLDDNNFALISFEISQGGLFGKKFNLPSSSAENFGSKIIIISDQVAAQLGIS